MRFPYLLAQISTETGAYGVVFIIVSIAITILALVWVVLPLILLNELGKVRRQLLHSEENILVVLQQITPAVQQLQEQIDAQKRAQETLDAISVHLFNIDGEVQHSNALLEWIGSQPGTIKK